MTAHFDFFSCGLAAVKQIGGQKGKVGWCLNVEKVYTGGLMIGVRRACTAVHDATVTLAPGYIISSPERLMTLQPVVGFHGANHGKSENEAIQTIALSPQCFAHGQNVATL